VGELASARAHSAAIVSPEESSQHSNAVRRPCKPCEDSHFSTGFEGNSRHRLAG